MYTVPPELALVLSTATLIAFEFLLLLFIRIRSKYRYEFWMWWILETIAFTGAGLVLRQPWTAVVSWTLLVWGVSKLHSRFSKPN